MPKLKYRPRRDIPRAVKELRSLSPLKIREWILNRFNEAVSPESVTNWFRRHQAIKDELERELIQIELPNEVIEESIFSNGTFEAIESVDNWIKDMRRRKVSPKYLQGMVNGLKQVCQGVMTGLGVDLTQHGWVLKHPSRLNLDDCIHFLDLIYQYYPSIDESHPRLVMRNFLLSKGIVVGTKISGQKHKSAGSYASLYVEKDVLNQIFEYLKVQNFEAYVCDRFMFKSGARISATLNAKLENLRVEQDGYAELKIWDKGRRSKYPEGHPWDKYVSPDLLSEISELTGYPQINKTGLIFKIDVDTIARINKEALEKFAPWILKQYPDVMPNHFWRHMFAQHMLRLTNWNYGCVAQLGGWTVKALEESYGMPPRATVRTWGLQTIPNL